MGNRRPAALYDAEPHVIGPKGPPSGFSALRPKLGRRRRVVGDRHDIEKIGIRAHGPPFVQHPATSRTGPRGRMTPLAAGLSRSQEFVCD